MLMKKESTFWGSDRFIDELESLESPQEEVAKTYGFFCQKTNTFYEFSPEAYE